MLKIENVISVTNHKTANTSTDNFTPNARIVMNFKSSFVKSDY